MTVESPWEAETWLVRTDATGNMVDNDAFGFPEGSGTGGEQAYSLVLTADGGFALTGYTNSFSSDGNRDIWLVKTLSNGDMDWNKVYKRPSDDYGQVVIQTSDGGYAVAGYTLSIAGGYDIWLIRTDSSGTTQWEQTYGRQGWDFAMGLVQNADGGYAVAGYTAEYYGATVYDFWLVMTDALGNVQWSPTYGGTSDDGAWGLVSTGDGGFAIAGFTSSFGWGNSGDAWLVFAYPPTFVVSPSAGVGGSISPSSPQSVNYGGSQAFSISANAGYHIVSVLVDGSSVGAVSSYTFTNVQASHTIAASFAINTYSLTVNVGSNGQSNIASQTVSWGTSLSFVFTPNVGYHVADVVVNGTSHLGSVTTFSTMITGSNYGYCSVCGEQRSRHSRAKYCCWRPSKHSLEHQNH